tara:strand:+ start:6274 stop:7299 length:1026 start_codon:yes stop_codon:yes gene_type:complete
LNIRNSSLYTKKLCGFFFAIIALLPVILQAGGNQPGEIKKTAWGDPDIQGIWEYWTFTPLERPDEMGNRSELSDEEAAAVAQEGVDAARATDAGAQDGDTGAYGQEVWTERSRAVALNQPSLIVDPLNGKIPAFTASEERRIAQHAAAGGRPVRTRAGGIGTDGPEDRGLAERCILGFSTGPPLLPAGYNNNVQVFQAPGYVVLVIEMIHDVRIIPLDGRAHLPANVTQWLGDARGRWEGETLVVETTNFPDSIGSFSTTSVTWGTGEDLTLIEKFTRLDDDTLEYEFTVNNPSIFESPFTARYPMNRSDLPLYEYACHEGNYGLMNILTGARTEDGTLTR